MNVPLILQPNWESLSGLTIESLSHSSLLSNDAKLSVTGQVAAYVIKLLIVLPLLLVCSAADLTLWTVKTIAVFPILYAGKQQHFTDLLATVVFPVIAIFNLFCNRIPLANRTPFQVNAKDESERRTRLHDAASHNDLYTIKRLHKAGADLNAIAKYSGSALQIAVEREYEDIVRYLLEQNVKINADIDNLHDHPLHHAINLLMQHPHPDPRSEVLVRIIKLLLEHGASPNSSDPERPTMLSHFFSRIPPTSPFYDEIVELMFSKGADPNCTVNGQALLTYAIEKGRSLKMVQKLLKHGADAQCNGAPFFSALRRRRADLLPDLISSMQKASQLEMVSSIGTTAMSHAVIAINTVAIGLLCNAGAKLDMAFSEDIVELIHTERQYKQDKPNVMVLPAKIEKPDVVKNPFINSFFHNFSKRYSDKVKNAELDTYLVTEREKARKVVLKEVFDQFTASVNMPPELINIIASY